MSDCDLANSHLADCHLANCHLADFHLLIVTCRNAVWRNVIRGNARASKKCGIKIFLFIFGHNSRKTKERGRGRNIWVLQKYHGLDVLVQSIFVIMSYDVSDVIV